MIDCRLEELAALVTGYFASMKLVQAHLGKQIHVNDYWFDVLIPPGPPLEYERSGYMIHSYHSIGTIH